MLSPGHERRLRFARKAQQLHARLRGAPQRRQQHCSRRSMMRHNENSYKRSRDVTEAINNNVAAAVPAYR